MKKTYDELIKIIQDNDCCGELINEEDLIEIIIDRLRYGFYGQAINFIEILSQCHDHFNNNNYWKNDCGTIIPLITEQDLIKNFDYLLN